MTSESTSNSIFSLLLPSCKSFLLCKKKKKDETKKSFRRQTHQMSFSRQLWDASRGTLSLLSIRSSFFSRFSRSDETGSGFSIKSSSCRYDDLAQVPLTEEKDFAKTREKVGDFQTRERCGRARRRFRRKEQTREGSKWSGGPEFGAWTWRKIAPQVGITGEDGKV